MNFYKSVYPWGNKMLVRKVVNGKSVQARESFQPTLYLPSDKPTNWTTLDGQYVKEFQPGTVKETKEFVERYKDVTGFDLYGNTNYPIQYLSDNYPGHIEWDKDLIRTLIIDIEVASENGFPNMDLADQEVLLISLLNLKNKKIVTFGSRPYEGENKDKYVQCKNEFSMLRQFLDFWKANYPDVVSGWNSEFFDIPYLVRRIGNVLGQEAVEELSPWGIIQERKVFAKGKFKEETTYNLVGISHLDYLALYKKFGTYSAQESYTLHYIAQKELKTGKIEHSEHDNFKDFYTKDWNKFVDYNIRDVVLVDKLDDKKRLFELALTLSYNAKINFETVYSAVNMWDAIIYNHLRTKNIVIPQKKEQYKTESFDGAYVKEPLIGFHKWVASIDLASLYPHLIMGSNISPETLVTDESYSEVTVDKLLRQEFDTSFLVKKNYAMTANGWMYRRNKRGFLPELMDIYYNDRSKFKKNMIKFKQEKENCKDDARKDELRKEIDKWNNMQLAYKIALNSAYGAVSNEYCRWYDLRLGTSVTLTGRVAIRWIEDRLNAFMNDLLKTKGVDYVIALDTDSIYLRMETLIESKYPDLSTSEKIDKMNEIMQHILKKIDGWYVDLAKYLNSYEQKMQMKIEVLADKGIWTAKKHYILNKHYDEGVRLKEPELKVMGLEMVKSSTPLVIREKMKEALKIIINGSETEVQQFVNKVYVDFKKMNPVDIAFPRSVNGMNKYKGPRVYEKGTPIHVRGALLFNYYINRHQLLHRYPEIKDGDKIKFIYLKKPNPINENIVSFVSEIPKEFNLVNYIDYELQFEKVFKEPLQTILDPLKWKVEKKVGLSSFWE